MTWAKELEELRRREALAEQMGGAEKVARQHARGKLDARARIAGLVDAGSFREIGKIAGKGHYGPDGELLDLSPSNLVFGRANIEGRPVVASADDFTVRGGAADAALHRKFVQCEAMAHEYRLPLIRMIDGTGGGAIAAFKAAGVDPVPPVTGNDATIAALQLIISGDQYNTISKPSEIVAAAAANVAVTFLKGETPEPKTSLYDTPSELFVPAVVTAENIKAEIFDKGITSAEEVCTGEYAEGCKALGITQ